MNMIKPHCQVVGIDHPVLDYVVQLDRLPIEGDRLPIRAVQYQGGGKVATGLVTLSKLGISTRLLGSVGRDLNGRLIVDELVSHGVDVTYLTVHPSCDSSLSIILSTGTDRSILYRSSDQLAWPVNEFDPTMWQDAAYLYLSHLLEPQVYVARQFKQMGGQVVLDADNLKPNESLIDHLSLVDHFIGSEEMYRHLFVEAKGGMEVTAQSDLKLKQLLEAHQNHFRHHTKMDIFEQSALIAQSLNWLSKKIGVLCAFTFGEKGCVFCTNYQVQYMPAMPVEVVDTTGAGDVFHGAYIAGLCQHMSIEASIKYATCAAALSTMGMGGRSSIPDAHTLAGRIQNWAVKASPYPSNE